MDKYKAIWISHSSLGDFLKCPRAYYLHNVYKDPKTKHKIQVTSPSLSLGQAVHQVIESLSQLSTKQRFHESLLDRYEHAWRQVSGRIGGFTSQEVEVKYKERGRAMLERVHHNPGPLKNLTVKIKQELPYYWISEEDNIILCGKIDWLEYLPETDSVHIIDFKTSKSEEDLNSLQLPIYHLLVHNCQKRKVGKASYWYLEFEDELSEKTLPDLDEAKQRVMTIAKKIKLSKQLGKLSCPKGAAGCYACRPFEKVLRGEAELVGLDNYHHDVYIIPDDADNRQESELI